MQRISTRPGRPHVMLWALLMGVFLSACNRDQPAADVVGDTVAGIPVAGTPADPYAGGKSYPWSDRLETGSGDPYAGGRSYAWTGHQATGGLGRLSVTSNPLSDLTWTGASSAWGPAEKDRSNGEQLAGDGSALSIGGRVYQKGLGVHAGSELRYTLNGFCSLFSASVGIDDEVGNRGSAVFQVWNGAALLYDSGVLRGSDAARAVSVNVGGVQTLRLVVTDGGDGIDYDHADWADARVSCESSVPPTGTSQLSGLNWQAAQSGWGPIEQNRSNGEQGAEDGRALSIGGAVYSSGLGVHAESQISWPLAGRCTEFSASVGIDDEVGNRGSAVFQVWNGAALLYDSGVLRGSDAARAVSVNVGGVQTLRLVVTDGGDGIDYDHADWADARVTCAATAPASVTLDYQPAAAQPYPVSEAQGLALNSQIYVFGGFDVLKGFTPTDRAYRFDPATDRWTALPGMPGRGVTHAGMTSDGASIYYAGGYIADSGGNGQIFGTRAAWQYDVALGSYSRLPELPIESAAGQLQVLNGKLHYFGGLDLSRIRDLSAHYVLDLSSRAAWTLAAPMPQPRNHFGSVVLGGRIYAVGGQTGTDEGLSVHNEMFVYDPGQDAWTQPRSLPVGRGHISGSTFVLGGRIVVAGGETAHAVASTEVSAYDPGTDTWTALTPLPQPRSSAVAAALDPQTLMFTGGTGPGGFQAGGWKATLR